MFLARLQHYVISLSSIYQIPAVIIPLYNYFHYIPHHISHLILIPFPILNFSLSFIMHPERSLRSSSKTGKPVWEKGYSMDLLYVCVKSAVKILDTVSMCRHDVIQIAQRLPYFGSKFAPCSLCGLAIYGINTSHLLCTVPVTRPTCGVM